MRLKYDEGEKILLAENDQMAHFKKKKKKFGSG